MERQVTRQMLMSRHRSDEEKEIVKLHVKTVSKDVLEYRKKVAGTLSDSIPSIMGDVQDGYSPILLVCGRQRKGKTRFGATMGQVFSTFLYYENFNHEKSFFLYPKKLLEKIDSEGYKIYLLDEAGSAGSGISKREWFSELAELFDYILQTQGNLGNIYIFILPFASDLASDIRKYVDYLMSAKKKGLFKCYKIYKKEDQLVKNLKDFKQVFIEMLCFQKKDLHSSIWSPIEKKCNKMKEDTRIEKLKRMSNKGNWLGG